MSLHADSRNDGQQLPFPFCERTQDGGTLPGPFTVEAAIASANRLSCDRVRPWVDEMYQRGWVS
jgi:hypothetical protein